MIYEDFRRLLQNINVILTYHRLVINYNTVYRIFFQQPFMWANFELLSQYFSEIAYLSFI